MDSIATQSQNLTWNWRGYAINYQCCGDRGTPVLLIHGFGASVGHWRKNLPVLGQQFRCYAIDLIGFGASAKPQPKTEIDYTFETWGELVVDFCDRVIGAPAVLVGNSIGCIVALQAAVLRPQICLGVSLIDCSLRLLHDRKRHTLPWYQQWGTPLLQSFLSVEWFGKLFFRQLAQRQVVRKVLLQAYHRPEAVTDELIDILMAPAADAGAAAVFLAFTTYSQGPLAEDLLPQISCPAIVLWGERDPWEPIELARQWADYPSVKAFIPLADVGHCPQDEAPELVNSLLADWIDRLATFSRSSVGG
jgi:pimeloyl-ACP methyl ester carboxylesterase